MKKSLVTFVDEDYVPDKKLQIIFTHDSLSFRNCSCMKIKTIGIINRWIKSVYLLKIGN